MARFVIWAVLLAGSVLLGACESRYHASDAPTGPAQDGDTASSLSLRLRIEDTAGRVTNEIRADAPGQAIATVTDDRGRGVPGVIVRFDTTLATLNPASGTVLTDASGKAVVGLLAGTATGADLLKVTSADGQSLTVSQAYAVASPAVRLGSGSGAAFSDGQLALGTATLSAGGTTGITASVVDANGDLFTPPITINFDSRCTAEGLAAIDSAVTTVNGAAAATYRAEGCEGSDTITARADFGGSSFVASAILSVLPASVGAIEFVSASPTYIALKGVGGAGLSETSRVTFRVRDTEGRPAANQQVDFTLSTSLAGLSLSHTTAQSDGQGEVSTVVQSGTRPTVIRVIATLRDSSIASQSDQLTISTGLPDQDSFSLSLSSFNPEAWNYDGQTVSATVRLADQFNNPVPDGTAISFQVEGGAIVSHCLTREGACSVTWTSQAPRPEGDPLAVPGSEPRKGRVTLLAYAMGVESFTDVNGNGVFDDKDLFTPDQDIGEPYQDDNENGRYDEGEPFLDFNGNGVYDGPGGDEAYNGILCEHASLCSASPHLYVWQHTRLVMSTSGGRFSLYRPGDPLDPSEAGAREPLPFSLDGGKVLVIRLEDWHGNAMPGGSRVNVTSTTGVLGGSTDFAIPSMTEPYVFVVSIAPGEKPGSGSMTISVTTPAGVRTSEVIGLTNL